jgi:hypothetical protein
MLADFSGPGFKKKTFTIVYRYLSMDYFSQFDALTFGSHCEKSKLIHFYADPAPARKIMRLLDSSGYTTLEELV